MVDSSVGFVSEVGSGSESVVGPSSTLSIGYVLEMQVDSDSMHSITE